MAWLDIRCPKCKQSASVPPGSTYKVCERCATPHCVMESGTCGVDACGGGSKTGQTKQAKPGSFDGRVLGRESAAADLVTRLCANVSRLNASERSATIGDSSQNAIVSPEGRGRPPIPI